MMAAAMEAMTHRPAIAASTQGHRARRGAGGVTAGSAGSTGSVDVVMSTVVLTLVVVGGSIAVAAKLAASGDEQPATDTAVPHRARLRGRNRPDQRPVRSGRRQRRTAVPGGTAVVDAVTPRPGLLVRLRAGFTLLAIVAVIGATIAFGLLLGAEVVSRALETAVS
jgi:hypothetical protein